MKYEHIIFDCDGVLVDSEIVAAEIMVPLLNTLGHAITVKHYLAHYTGKTFKTILDQFDIDLRIDIEMLIKNVEEKVYLNIKAIKGIEKIVKSIDLPKSVVSNSGPEQIKHSVESIGLSDHFVNQFSSSFVKNPKPSPEIYNYAIEKLNLPSSKLLVIEDSISGCTAAIEANLTVIGFCGGGHISTDHANVLEKLGVHHIAKNTSELGRLLKDLIKKAN